MLEKVNLSRRQNDRERVCMSWESQTTWSKNVGWKAPQATRSKSSPPPLPQRNQNPMTMDSALLSGCLCGQRATAAVSLQNCMLVLPTQCPPAFLREECGKARKLGNPLALSLSRSWGASSSPLFQSALSGVAFRYSPSWDLILVYFCLFIF